ncbi:MAG: hypothetical protein ACI8X3_003002 [Saprospiraceae bacterium]|jgi:hypothetical protein
MKIKKGLNQKNLIRSSISDYGVFLIGMILVILSTFSDLNQNSKTGQHIPKEQENLKAPSPALEEISILKKEEYLVKFDAVK